MPYPASAGSADAHCVTVRANRAGSAPCIECGYLGERLVLERLSRALNQLPGPGGLQIGDCAHQRPGRLVYLTEMVGEQDRVP